MGYQLCNSLADTGFMLGIVTGVFGMAFVMVIATVIAVGGFHRSPYRGPNIARPQPPVWRSGPGANNHH